MEREIETKQNNETKLMVTGIDRSIKTKTIRNFLARLSGVTDFILERDSKGYSRGFGYLWLNCSSDEIQNLITNAISFKGQDIKFRSLEKDSESYSNYLRKKLVLNEKCTLDAEI